MGKISTWKCTPGNGHSYKVLEWNSEEKRWKKKCDSCGQFYSLLIISINKTKVACMIKHFGNSCGYVMAVLLITYYID